MMSATLCSFYQHCANGMPKSLHICFKLRYRALVHVYILFVSFSILFLAILLQGKRENGLQYDDCIAKCLYSNSLGWLVVL